MRQKDFLNNAPVQLAEMNPTRYEFVLPRVDDMNQVELVIAGGQVGEELGVEGGSVGGEGRVRV